MNYSSFINYDPLTGVFVWAASRPGCSAGKVAGSINREGYRVIKVQRKPLLAHRLAWLMVTGEWPASALDHKNGCRDDNRIDNLREADHSVNMQNKRRAMKNNKSSGLLGVTWNKQHKRWQSKLMVNKKSHHVGLFDCPEKAHAAYLEKKRQLHAGCTI
jgi:hypothetical protein